MKFLTFNILVGAALAWLVLGGGETPALLKSMLPASASAHHLSADCPVNPPVEEASVAAARMDPPGPASDSERIETSFPDQTPPPDVKQLASRAPDRSPPASPAPPSGARTAAPVTGPDQEAAPPSPPSAVEPSVGRRDALLSLAESMELFSLERVAK